MEVKKKVRNNSIDMFRLICAVLVVAIHTQPLYEVNEDLGFWATQILPRIAVPFFFAVAGYYYINSLMSGKKVFLHYIKRLLLVYTLWSVIYFLIGFVDFVIVGDIGFFSYIKICIIKYFIYGSNYQLWFFPALFFAVILTTICYKIKAIRTSAIISVGLFVIGCLGCSYFKLGNQIPFISTLINHQEFTLIRRVVLMGFPFFMLGYFLNIWKIKFSAYSFKKEVVLIVTTFALFLLEILLVVYFRLEENVILTFMLYPLLALVCLTLLNHPLEKQKKIGQTSRICANFMYYAHPVFMILMDKIFQDSLFPTIQFMVAVILSIIGGLAIKRLNNKWINKFVI